MWDFYRRICLGKNSFLANLRPVCLTESWRFHTIEAAPSYITTARRADLWISVGMDLEIGWERPVIDGPRNRRIRPGTEGYLDASENVIKTEIPEGRVTYAMGDVHPQGNPHYWADPLQGRIVAAAIAARLAKLAPEHRETFGRNLERFQDEIDRRTFGARLVDEVGGERLWVPGRSPEAGSYFQFLDNMVDTFRFSASVGALQSGPVPGRIKHRGRVARSTLGFHTQS